jgi:hypothetical protein
VIAVVALALTAGGVAVAAIPDSKGVIHACYATKGGAVRVVGGDGCHKGERKLAWNRKGRPGLKNVAVRSKSMVLRWDSCTPTGGGSFSCHYPETTVTVPCGAAERATGGGYGRPTDGTPVNVRESRPVAAQGARPSGWLVRVGEGAQVSQTASHPDTFVPIHVACAPQR